MVKAISKTNVISSMLFKAMEKIGGKAIGFIVSVVLARLIAPELFGVLAIIMAIVSIVQVFVDSGLNVSLIQNKTTTISDYSTVFYISLSIAIVIYLILFFLAHTILDFFNMAEFKLQFRVLLIIVLFYAYNSIQTAQLTREMKFKQMFICHMISIVISGIIGITAAELGYGIWALVVYYVSNAVITCITFSVISEWHPQLVFSFDRAKLFFGFGVRMLGASLLTSFFYQLRTFVVGKLFSSADLAFYTRGDQIPNIISSTVDNVFKSVLLPVYARKQDSKDELLRILRRTIQLNSYLNFPAMCGLSATAFALVTIIYTSKWESCVLFLQILSFANMPASITSPCLVSIQAIGKGDTYLKLEVVRRIVMTIILIVSILFRSLSAIAYGWLISSIIDALLVVFVAKRIIGYSYGMMVKDVFPNLIASLTMFAIVCFIGIMVNYGVMVTFIAQVFTGTITYLLISIIFKMDSFKYFCSLLKAKAIK